MKDEDFNNSKQVCTAVAQWVLVAHKQDCKD